MQHKSDDRKEKRVLTLTHTHTLPENRHLKAHFSLGNRIFKQ